MSAPFDFVGPDPADTSQHPANCSCNPCRVERRVDAGRRSENVLAYAGAAQAVFAGVMESLVRAGFRLGEGEAQTGIPWVNLAILFVCVLPKTVGRRTGGKVWEAIAARFGGTKP